MRKPFITTLTALAVLTAVPAAAETVSVCAVPQLYQTLQTMQQDSGISFTAEFDTTEALFAGIGHKTLHCDLVLSSDEKLPILLIRSRSAKADSMKPFATAPLLLWSADERLFARGLAGAEIRTLAVPKDTLTPVGFAAARITEQEYFPSERLEGKIYRTDQEYQTLALVDSGNVHAGFVTRPLVSDGKGGISHGSAWEAPLSDVPDLTYYATLTPEGEQKPEARELHLKIQSDPRWQQVLKACGFIPAFAR